MSRNPGDMRIWQHVLRCVDRDDVDGNIANRLEVLRGVLFIFGFRELHAQLYVNNIYFYFEYAFSFFSSATKE